MNVSNLFRLGVVVVLAGVLGAAFLLAQGGDDKTDGSSREAITGYFVQFTNVFNDFGTKVKALQDQYPDANTDLEQSRDFYPRYLDEYDRLVENLADIDAPDLLKDEHDAFIEASRSVEEFGQQRLEKIDAAKDSSELEGIFTPDDAFQAAMNSQAQACVALNNVADSYNLNVSALNACASTESPTATPAPSDSSTPVPSAS